jgi:serine/threonine protein kinase/Tfp pilus assembly protein PilF
MRGGIAMPGWDPEANDLFLRAREIGVPEDRQRFLDEACAGKPELRARVDGLLRAGAEAGSFLEQPAEELGATGAFASSPHHEPVPVSPERPGTVIGPYKLMEQIGEGGMGLVFVAEQQQPIRRKVALKVIKPGMDTRQVVARFEAERQALALMDHPNIARVHDGGETAGGRPFFVMELVKGVPITEHCDQSQVPIRERLELFLSVCQAVQHAHQKGIIHRDIKPSNVMVMSQDGTPLVKVIDFGVAKAIGQQLTDKTIYTQFTQMVGTPLYMSPEQAGQSGLDVDTRSDIYSLGVLLYELLTGTTPFDQKRLREVGFDEIRRIIREEEPRKPSTRISTLGPAAATVSANRKSDPKQLSRLCRRELDWIVMKALEKDRNRRYETASAFAADVVRYLHDEPVQACPPSMGYRFRKLARRNKVPLAMASLLVAALVLTTLILALSNVRIQNEKQQKETAFQQARANEERARKNVRVALKALDGIYLQVAEERLPRDAQRKKEDSELLKKAMEFYQQFAEQNSSDPRVRLDVGRAYRRVGDIRRFVGEHATAQQAYLAAIATGQALATDSPHEPEFHYEVAVSHNALGEDLLETGQLAEAGAHFRQAADLLAQLTTHAPSVASYRAELARSHHGQGSLLRRQGRRSAAEESFRDALAIQSKLAADFPTVPQYRADLAEIQLNWGSWMEGTRANGDPEKLRQAVKLLTDLVAECPQASLYKFKLAITLEALAAYAGPRAERIDSYNQAIDLLTKLAADSPQVPEYDGALHACYGNLGELYRMKGDWDKAGECWRKSLDLSTKQAAKFPGVTRYREHLIASLLNWSEVLIYHADLAEARRILEQSLEYSEPLQRSYPDNLRYASDVVVAKYLLSASVAALGDNALAAKRKQEGDEVLKQACARVRAHRGPSVAAAFYASLATELEFMGAGLANKNRQQELANLYGVAIELLGQAEEFEPKNVHHLAWLLATCPDAKLRDPDRAVKLARKAVESAPKDGSVWNTLGVAHYRASDWKAAIAALHKSMELRNGDAWTWFFLAMACWQLEKKEEARKWYDQAVQWMEQNQPKNQELGRFRAEAAELLGVKDEKK